MEKLVSLREKINLVRQRVIDALPDEIELMNQQRQDLEEIYRYSDFLSQPLTMSMFVPCDKDGNVLSEPNRSTHTNEECEAYNEAKSKVLFQISSYKKTDDDEYEIHLFPTGFRRITVGYGIIEDLYKQEPLLTPHAKQLIFG